MRVPDDFQNMNLPTHPLNIVHVSYLRFVKDLDRNLLIGQDVNALLDFAKGALAERLGNSIGADSKSFDAALLLQLLRLLYLLIFHHFNNSIIP